MKVTKKKKLIACLLILVLALALTGCVSSASYEPDPDSTCGAIVGSILIFLQKMTAAVGLPNFCVAIFILTVIVKLVTHPLTLKQQKNVKSMGVIQPKMEELNRKYAENPQKKQEEIMKLYREENINPMASCLPMLIQMPIIMILFWGIRNFIPPESLVQYYSFFWINDLSVIINTTQWHWILPILCALTTVLQQIFSMPNIQDKTQRMMLIIMPLMFLFIAPNFPAGLCLYWIFYGIVTALQTLFINWQLKIGFFASKEEKEKRKEMKTQTQQQKAAAEEKARRKNENNQQRQQVHPHTHNNTPAQRDESKLPDKPWQ